jgi:uncharacterized membrane protein (DUF106 family)
MLTETILTTMIQVGVTGAGLVLAIYALIIPISRRMFIDRARLLRKQIKKFEEQKSNLKPEASDKEFKSLQQLAEKIKETKIFPRYLDIGVFLVFTFYMLLTIMGFTFLSSPLYQTAANELLIIIIFSIANVGFLFLGITTIADISWTMHKEYERIKKEEDDKTKELLFVK